MLVREKYFKFPKVKTVEKEEKNILTKKKSFGHVSKIMADKFGIGTGPHELKIGNSFANRGKNGAGHPGNFHTIRYDFKPASLDPSKSGVLAVTENSLNVKVPHSNGSTETNYRYI